jgi:hypothetical protein
MFFIRSNSSFILDNRSSSDTFGVNDLLASQVGVFERTFREDISSINQKIKDLNGEMELGFKLVSEKSKEEYGELKTLLEGVSDQVATLTEAIAKLSVGAPRSSTSTESSTASGPITFTRYRSSSDSDSIDDLT